MDRNQELLTRIRQFQEREAEAEEKLKEQLERHRLCQQSLDAASRKLREMEDSRAQAGEVRPPHPVPRPRACLPACLPLHGVIPAHVPVVCSVRLS